MVTGGEIGKNRGQTDSTEVFDNALGSWVTSGALPRPMYGLRATNIDGRVLIFGNIVFATQSACPSSFILLSFSLNLYHSGSDLQAVFTDPSQLSLSLKMIYIMHHASQEHGNCRWLGG